MTCYNQPIRTTKIKKKNDDIKCSKGGGKKISYVLIMGLCSSEKWFDSLL